MTQKIKKIELTLESNQNKIFWSIMVAIILSSCIYIYFSSFIIIKIVEKNNNLKRLQTINTEYRQLEEKYFNFINKVDLQYAQSLGFVEQKNNNFAVRQTTVARK